MERLCDPGLAFRLVSVFEDVRGDMDTQAEFPRPYHALSCRIKGDAVFCSSEQTVSAGDSSVLYMPADTPYHITTGQERLVVIHFEVSAPMSKRFTVVQPVSPAVIELFLTLHRVWQEKAPGYALRALSLLYSILEQLYHLTDDSRDQQRLYRRLRPALELVYERLADPTLTVDALAQSVGLGETRFRTLFLGLTGMTPLQYLNRLRIDYAADLLCEGVLRVEEVAWRCGFSDSKYFSTVFRKYKGDAPSRYRERPPSH